MCEGLERFARVLFSNKNYNLKGLTMKRTNPAYLNGLIVAGSLSLCAGLSAQSTTVTTQERNVTTSPVPATTVVTPAPAPSATVVTPAPAPVNKVPASVTYATGSVTEFAPSSRVVTVRTESSPSPVQYSITNETVYEDEAGRPVAVEAIRPGIPTRVYYTQSGDGWIASRIVIVGAAAPAPAAAPAVIEREVIKRPKTEDEREAEKELREARREAKEDAKDD